MVDGEGDVVEKRRLRFERVIDAGTAFLATSLLEGVAERGTAESLPPPNGCCCGAADSPGAEAGFEVAAGPVVGAGAVVCGRHPASTSVAINTRMVRGRSS